tara:strand:+ start:146 stop:781 length:636 start_codon:yes stop_codon:yes gene_type:complete
MEGEQKIEITEEIKDDVERDLIKENEELMKQLALAQSTAIERPKKGYKKNGEPRKKAEMTEARKKAIEKMREGRKKWLEEKKKSKASITDKKINKVEKPKKIIKEPEIIEEESSDEEIIVKPKPKPRKKKKKKIIYEPPSESSESEEEIIVVKAPRRKKNKYQHRGKVKYVDEPEVIEEQYVENPDPQLFTSPPKSQNELLQDMYGGIKFR